MGEPEKTRELSDELLEIEPAPEARVAYVRALHTQLLGYAVSAAHERGQRSLDFIDKLGTDISEPDVAARVALARGDWARAETEGRKARAGLSNMPPYGLMASAYLLQALARQRRWEEACVIAREDLIRLEQIAGPVCTEVLFRVAAAEALFGGGHRVEAESALTEALRQIQLRADKIPDPTLKRSYLTQRHENRRAAELASKQAPLLV